MSSGPSTSDPVLDQLFDELPERYQPIYGHPDLISAREHEGLRIEALLSVVDAVAATVDRPLRVLDLGSAQGYLAFRIAERGHHVTGLEFVDANIAMSEHLRTEHHHLDTRFVTGDVSDVEQLVDLATFDLVLGFSILHHLVHRDGNEATAALVDRIATAVPHAVFEMAVAAEPVHWSVSLPRDPRHTIGGYPFCRQMAVSTTHLSEVVRPVLFCSRTHVLVEHRLVPFTSWTDRSHERSGDAQAAVVRYFHLDGMITKVVGDFSADADPDVVLQLRADLRREHHVLEALSIDDDVPKVVEFADGEGTTLIARTAVAGVLLSVLLESLTDDERTYVTTQVLAWLAHIESLGLHHSDLRCWNVVLDRTSHAARVIDFGAIRAAPTDAVWPHDAHYSLLLFLAELWSGRMMRTGEDLPRSLEIDGGEISARGVRLLSSLLTMQAGDSVATRLTEQWTHIRQQTSDELWPVPPLAWGWLVTQAVRSAWTARTLAEFENLRREHAALHVEHVDLGSRSCALESDLRHQLDTERQSHVETAAQVKGLVNVVDRQASEIHRRTNELNSLWFEHNAVIADRDQVRWRAETAEAALAAARRSLSWRLTAPLRRLRHIGVVRRIR